MPPTDCFDVSDPGRASLPSCGTETQLQLLPTTRSPLHHGTDPDLSAPTPLPGGVALADLDLSPMTAGHCSLAVLAKMKSKSHMAAALMSSQPMCLPRGLPSGEKNVECDAKKAAVHEQSGELAHQQQQQSVQIARPACFASHTVHSSIRSGTDNKRAASTQLRHIPAGSDYEKLPESKRAESVDDSDGSQPSELQGLESPRTGVRVAFVPEDGQVEQAEEKKQQQQLQQQKSGTGTGASLEVIMAKAKVAADNIRLLLHAKRCDNPCCKEPGCSSAKQLVEHMRGCGASSGKPCGDLKCRKAHKILLHYAECRRALGGRYCLVCSLVARSPGGGQSRGNSNVVSSPRSPPQGRRQPLGRVGTLSARGRSLSSRSFHNGSGLEPPVAIARFKRGDRMRGTPASASSGMGRFVKDGAFFRPMPKARSGSWGGYDRRRCMRRTRIDSIPEEMTEEEDDEDDKDNQEVPSETASKSSDDGSRGKTLVTSLSL